MLLRSILSHVLYFVSFSFAMTKQSVYTARVTVDLNYDTQTQLKRSEWSTSFHTVIKPCPYKHTEDVVNEQFQFKKEPKKTENQESPHSPKVVSLKAKVSPKETEKILQWYMKQVLQVFELKDVESKEWEQDLAKISRQILECDVSERYYVTASGLKLAEYADEVQKAINYLRMTYKTIKEGLYGVDRHVAIHVFEEQLNPILQNLEMAWKFHNHAAIMEQKWRSYFLVNLARERLSPLSLKDHEIFEQFCQIYNKVFENPREVIQLNKDSTTEQSPLTKKWREAFQFILYMKQKKGPGLSMRGCELNFLEETEL